MRMAAYVMFSRTGRLVGLRKHNEVGIIFAPLFKIYSLWVISASHKSDD